VTRLQFCGGIRERISEIVQGNAVQNDAKWIGFLAQRRGRRSEHASAKFALPELDNLKFLAACAFADCARAAAVRAARGRFDRVGTRWACAGEVAIHE
jgi:hypothetical protein